MPVSKESNTQLIVHITDERMNLVLTLSVSKMKTPTSVSPSEDVNLQLHCSFYQTGGNSAAG